MSKLDSMIMVIRYGQVVMRIMRSPKTLLVDPYVKQQLSDMTNTIISSMNKGKAGEVVRFFSEEFQRTTTLNKDKAGEVAPERMVMCTDYDYIDCVNILEVNNYLPDVADVRLELIDKGSKSTKISVDVEKIKSEWKISRLSFNQ